MPESKASQDARPRYSAEALRCNGFGLRNALTLSSYAEVIRQVLASKK